MREQSGNQSRDVRFIGTPNLVYLAPAFQEHESWPIHKVNQPKCPISSRFSEESHVHCSNAVQLGDILRLINVTFQKVNVLILLCERFEGRRYSMARATPRHQVSDDVHAGQHAVRTRLRGSLRPGQELRGVREIKRGVEGAPIVCLSTWRGCPPDESRKRHE
jgi:hypothetical protein